MVAPHPLAVKSIFLLSHSIMFFGASKFGALMIMPCPLAVKSTFLLHADFFSASKFKFLFYQWLFHNIEKDWRKFSVITLFQQFPQNGKGAMPSCCKKHILLTFRSAWSKSNTSSLSTVC